MIPSSTVIVTGELGDLSFDENLVKLTDSIHAIWTEDPAKHATSVHATVDLDGVVILDRQLHVRAESILKTWAHVPLEDFAQRWGYQARQAGCAYIWDEARQELAILPDPLGGASLFCHTFRNVTVWSTDYRSLIRTLMSLGDEPRKDPDYQIERLLTGNGGLTPTSYVGGKRVPAFHAVLANCQGTRTVRYDSARVLHEPRSYLESANGVRMDALQSVTAAAEGDIRHRISHLTGGLDSRMVLGAMLEADVASQFAFFCSGPPGTPDRDVADGLTRALRLQRTNSGGLTPLAAGDHTAHRVSLLNYTAGLSTVGPTGLENQLPLVVCAGGYGELMRPFHRSIPTDDPNRWKDPQALMRSVLGSQTLSGLLSEDAVDRVGQKMSHELLSMHEEGIPIDFIPNALYIRIRNRYLVGAKALTWSRVGVQLNPLYSLHAVAGSASLTHNARDANVLMFDILTSFGFGLANYPFDKPKFPPELKRQRRTLPDLRFPTVGRIDFIEVPTQPNATTVESAPMTAAQRDYHVTRANAHGVPFWQSVHIDAAQADLASSLEESDSVDAMFSRKYLQGLTRTHEWNRTRIRHLFAAALISRWWVQRSA